MQRLFGKGKLKIHSAYNKTKRKEAIITKAYTLGLIITHVDIKKVKNCIKVMSGESK
jgi:hypothetical protein